MQDKLNAIIERHCKAIKRDAGEIDAMLKAVASGGNAPRAGIEAAEALAHQLKGGSGTAGFAAICEAVTALDDQLKTLLGCPDAEILAGVHPALLLSGELIRIAERTEPGASKLYVPLG